MGKQINQTLYGVYCINSKFYLDHSTIYVFVTISFITIDDFDF